MKQHLDENGFDHQARIQHCGHCEEPIFQYLSGTVLKPHRSFQWEHYVVMDHGAVTKLKLDARTLLTHIPRQSNLSFCLGCLGESVPYPPYPQPPVDNLCTACQQSVDKSDSYSQAQVVDRLDGDIFKYRGRVLFHSECLSQHFDKIHEKRTA